MTVLKAETEEHKVGDTVWVGIRANGSSWSWLTPEEAVRLAREWMRKYEPKETP